MEKVYFFVDASERVKIGFTTDVPRRHRELCNAGGEPLYIARVIDGGRVTERWLHRRFAESHIGGEWFEFHSEMLTVIPPDELPRVPTIRPVLRTTLKEELKQADEAGLFSDDATGRRLLALTLVSAMSDEDLAAFLSWVRERTGLIGGGGR